MRDRRGLSVPALTDQLIVGEVTAAERRNALRTVCHHATDAAEATMFARQLGLIGDTHDTP